jgi:hypothetical protein
MEQLQWLWDTHPSIVVSVLSFAAVWYFGKDKVVAFLGKISDFLDARKAQYLHAKEVFKSKQIYEKAEMAYEYISKLSRKTENGLDDKASRGLKRALELLKKAGWGPGDIGEDEKDLILAHFDRLHEAEHRLLEASKGVPVSNRASAAGEIAAPLAPAEE